MSQIRDSVVQVGNSASAANNMVLDTSAGDGTSSLYMGAPGIPTKTIMTTDNNGLASFPNGFGPVGLSKSANGYCCLPGGLILQWGEMSNTGLATTATFPIPFPNRVLNIQMTCAQTNPANGAVAASYALVPITTSSFVWNSSVGTQTFSTPDTVSMRWIAIGY